MGETAAIDTSIDSDPHQRRSFRLPSAVLVIGAILSFQLGYVVAKPAIEVVGPVDASFVRLLIGATFLLIWTRPNPTIVRQNWRLIGIAGAVMVAMNVLMLGAIERIPVGIAVATETRPGVAHAIDEEGLMLGGDFIVAGFASPRS